MGLKRTDEFRKDAVRIALMSGLTVLHHLNGLASLVFLFSVCAAWAWSSALLVRTAQTLFAAA